MATRACDGCFVRKIRCSRPARSPSSLGAGVTACKQCEDIMMVCTCDRPQKRRPRRRMIAPNEISPSTVESSGTPDFLRELLSAETPSPGVSPGVVSQCDFHSPPQAGDGYHGLGHFPTVSSTSMTNNSSIFDRPGEETRELFNLIIKDYLDIIYPLIPLVHQPIFKENIVTGRASRDPLFHSQILSIVCMVLAMLPRRFLEHRNAGHLFHFRTPAEMIEPLEQAILRLRSYDYMEEATTEKCVIAYLLAVAFGGLNIPGRSALYFAELWVLLKALGAQYPDNYAVLDHVEAQLRKKVFWLYVIFVVHERIGISDTVVLPWTPVPDQMLFDAVHFEALLPLALDDEYVTPETLLPQSQLSAETSVTAGFISLVRIYACMINLPDESNRVRIGVSSPNSQDETETWIRRSHDPYTILRRMFDRVRYVLDDLPPTLAAWQNDSHPRPAKDGNRQKTNHLESIRANIHVSRLWARSCIFERLTTLDNTAGVSPFMDERSRWAEREDNCEKLLHLLYNIEQTNLEPSGISLTYKIRQVAAPLLECSFEDHTSISRRARRYIEQFMELLTLLDRYSFQDTQFVVWKDFEKQRRQPASDFMLDP